MTEKSNTKKEVKKNPYPLVIKGVFYVTATYEDKQYVVSNGLSFIRFKKDDDDIKKGDYINIHGCAYQRKGSANPIITGESIVTKLTDAEVEEYKEKTSKLYESLKKDTTKKVTSKKKSENTDEKYPWE